MIYFRDGEKCTSVKDIIDKGFFGRKFLPTFWDKDLRVSQCGMARRSFYDLVEIVQTYFPKVSIQQVAYELVHHPEISAAYCCDIKKIIFMKGSFIGYQDCYGGGVLEGDEDSTGLSYNDILKLSEAYEMQSKN